MRKETWCILFILYPKYLEQSLALSKYLPNVRIKYFIFFPILFFAVVCFFLSEDKSKFRIGEVGKSFNNCKRVEWKVLLHILLWFSLKKKKYSVVETNSLVGRVWNISEHVQEGSRTRMETLAVQETLLGIRIRISCVLSASCLLIVQLKESDKISGRIAPFPSPLLLLTSAVIKQHLYSPLRAALWFPTRKMLINKSHHSGK